MPDETIGDRIRRLRSEKGWSLSDLARRAHVDRSQIWKIETNETKHPRLATLQRLATAFGAELEVLIDGAPREQVAPIKESLLAARRGEEFALMFSPGYESLGFNPEEQSAWLRRIQNFKRLTRSLYRQLASEPEPDGLIQLLDLETGEPVFYRRVEEEPSEPASDLGGVEQARTGGAWEIAPEDFTEGDYDYPQPWRGGHVQLGGSSAAGSPIESESGEDAQVLNPIVRDVQSGRYVVVRVKGDSMLPRLKDGDLVVIDTYDKELGPRKIHAVYVYGEGSMLGVVHDVSGALVVTKANTDYPPRILNPDVDRFMIQGRVTKRLEEEFE